MTTLIDSNVLIHSIDPEPSPYSVEAVKVLTKLGRAGTGVLSAQGLAEFAVHALEGLDHSPSWVAQQVRSLRRVFPVVPLTGEIVIKALYAMYDQPLSYFDAQVMATARVNGIQEVVTEGLWHGVRKKRVVYRDLVRKAPTLGWTHQE